jgi:predicted Ser/Thr protein kinase
LRPRGAAGIVATMGDARVGSEELATVRLQQAPPEPPPPEPPPAPAVAPTWAGRYTLVRKLAEGGMGAVYIAYDDQLDRRVAVKLLRQAVRSPTFQQRMHREAQALARLSHPNVVQVYDVGHHDDQLFVAMELVVGSDLRKWWKAAPRGWRAVLDVILQAGEGLAAAHRAGLVHRDIKPDNILVGDDGRVRVADFGLARAEASDAADPAPAPHHDEPRTPGSLLDAPLTEQGHILGTPAYMAPEQLLRVSSGARSDLFALCVVLYEGIYGERPFRGKTWQELAVAANAGLYTPPVRDPPIPAWLTRALARGLSADPDDRHPTIDALLTELRRPQQLVRRRWQWGVALGGLGLGLGIGVAALQREPPCVGADAAAAALWTADRQASVHAALVAVSPIAGAEISERLTARLGQRVHDLGDMSRETCLAYRRGELSDNLYDRARACLDRRRGEVAALLAVLSAPDAETVAKSLTAVDALRDLAACSDRAALIAQVAPPDPASAGPAAQLEHRLDQARALRLAGRYTEVDGLLAPLVADAQALAHPPLIVEARIERALVGLELARVPAAADDLSAAAALAESIGADELRLAALTAWLRAAGLSEDPSPALLAALEPQALALVERRGDTGRKAHARVLLAAGEANLDRDQAHASDRLTAAIAVFEALGDAAKPELAETLNDLAVIRTKQRRYPEAHALYQRARELLESTFGPHHPNLGVIANNDARVFDKQGDHASARTWFSAAVALWEPVYGPDHPNTLIAVLHLARMSHELGDDAAAASHAGRVLASRARIHGEDHPSLAPPLQLLARIDLARGDRTAARARSERALAIRERADGPTSPKLFDELELLMRIALADARPADALALAERRLAIARTDAARAAANLDVAEVHWARGDHDAARTAAALAQAQLPDKAAAWLAAHPRP